MDLSQDAIIGILVAIVAADIIVIVVALLWSRVEGRKPRLTATGPASGSAAVRPNGQSMNGGNNHGDIGTHSVASMNAAGRIVSVVPPIEATNDPTTDSLTGLLLPSAWARIVTDEDARIKRYHRSATIVVIELEGLDRLVQLMGPGSLERILPAVADTIRRGARDADHVARLGTGRFAVMMPETDEVLAINFVERIRRACELWLEAGAVALHLAMGWASSAGDGTLADVETTATDRMYVELRRTARTAGPTDPTVGEGGAGGLEPAFG
jgi:diguanylate cyclase (GGDEF)-like protein